MAGIDNDLANARGDLPIGRFGFLSLTVVLDRGLRSTFAGTSLAALGSAIV